MNQSNDMTRMLGLEVSYYLGHEGNKFYDLSKHVLQIFSDGLSLTVWLTRKVFLHGPISCVLKSIMIFKNSPEFTISPGTLHSTL